MSSLSLGRLAVIYASSKMRGGFLCGTQLGPFYEIYDFNSNSWRVLDVDQGCGNIRSGVSVKGNTYFLAEETRFEYFLLCFDFTAERFGQRIVLPFGACVSFSKTVVLSRVRDEQLAVLHQLEDNNVMEFWITSKIEPNAASWTRFLRVEMTPFRFVTESFFIDEEKKLALVSGFLSSATAATMESPAPAPGTSSATVAFPVVGSIVGASLSAFLALLLQ
ncbi:hypothetical protein Bca4012_004577 [Brassica carinata]